MGGIAGNKISAMRNVYRKRLSGASTKVDSLLKKITLIIITTLNKLMHCGGIINSELLGVKSRKDKQNNYPIWKKRLENQMNDLCKDLDSLIELIKGNKLAKNHSDQLQRKYFLNQTGFVYVMEEIRQRIKSKRGKLNRYTDSKQYQEIELSGKMKKFSTKY